MTAQSPNDPYDLLVIGGGVNGCGIAADAAGRGLRVILAEMSDLASGTSSASSKLIHGGLRYLEHYEFRLVREALAEREVLLRKAPHIVWPLRFVLPHGDGLRPRWMIRAGLFLYDHLARRRVIPGSAGLDLRGDPAGKPLRPEFSRGFAYWDCWVDDARLVVLNARAAADQGAEILTRTKVVSAEPAEGHWRARLETERGAYHIRARALANAAGPWAGAVARLTHIPGSNTVPALRLVKGSHIVVPRIEGANDAYLLQNSDGRVVFALPFEEHFTIVGTTDVPYVGEPSSVHIEPDEEAYLLAVAARFFRTPINQADIVWRYSGVRPLYDDASSDPSAVTRDYRIEMTASGSTPPLMTVLGGKVTTYRRLAEEAVDRLAALFPHMGPAWTASVPLPGGDMHGADFESYVARLIAERPGIDAGLLRRIARRHGTSTEVVLADAPRTSDLGADLGYGLTEREIIYLRDREWARSADDVLWRRTKVGLHLDPIARERAGAHIEDLLKA